MNALFGELEESGEGDLRSTMSSGLGLKCGFSLQGSSAQQDQGR